MGYLNSIVINPRSTVVVVLGDKMATAETHRCNNCKIPLEYRTLLRLTCHHEFCTFCFDIQGHNVKQPCQLCYKITVPKHADREHLRQVEESDELQPSSLRPTTGETLLSYNTPPSFSSTWLDINAFPFLQNIANIAGVSPSNSF